MNQLVFLAFCAWVVYQYNRAAEQHGEECRRYQEKYPLGEPKSRYEQMTPEEFRRYLDGG